jgi:hypothetical protein
MKKSPKTEKLVTQSCCFDLQFRKDTRHERTGSPTYYRWKLQFIITCTGENLKLLKKAQKLIGCGKIHLTKNQARLSVQNINDIANNIVPFFKNRLDGSNKKKDFDLWQRAVEMIKKNKGLPMNKWEKTDVLKLMQIHTLSSKVKNIHRKPKWIEMAQSFSKTSPDY